MFVISRQGKKSDDTSSPDIKNFQQGGKLWSLRFRTWTALNYSYPYPFLEINCLLWVVTPGNVLIIVMENAIS